MHLKTGILKDKKGDRVPGLLCKNDITCLIKLDQFN